MDRKAAVKVFYSGFFLCYTERQTNEPYRRQTEMAVCGKRTENRCSVWISWVTAAVGAVFLMTLSVVCVLNLRSIYYYNITSQNLCEETGLSEEALRENYEVLITYNSLLGPDELEFPDFPMSEHGRIHFKEVKVIFLLIERLCIASGILLLLLIFFALQRREIAWMKRTAIVTLVLPLGAGMLIGLNWERFFTGFHELVFSNDYWLFDPATDPVILALPDAFFFDCAAAIVLILLACCAALFLLYHILKKKIKL